MDKKISLSKGQFHLDENLLKSGLYCYKTSIELLEKNIPLNIFLNDKLSDKLEDQLEIIEKQVNWLQSSMAFVEEEIGRSHLVEVKNASWLEEGEDEVTPDQFIQRITLLSVSIDINDGRLDNTNLEYDDDDIFWGHRISVDIVNGKVSSVDI